MAISYSDRQKKLIRNCRDYAKDPGGLPGHELMLLVKKMADYSDRVDFVCEQDMGEQTRAHEEEVNRLVTLIMNLVRWQKTAPVTHTDFLDKHNALALAEQEIRWRKANGKL